MFEHVITIEKGFSTNGLISIILGTLFIMVILLFAVSKLPIKENKIKIINACITTIFIVFAYCFSSMNHHDNTEKVNDTVQKELLVQWFHNEYDSDNRFLEYESSSDLTTIDIHNDVNKEYAPLDFIVKDVNDDTVCTGTLMNIKLDFITADIPGSKTNEQKQAYSYDVECN